MRPALGVLLAFGLLAAACSGGDEEPAEPEPESEEAAEASGVVWPLTGLPVQEGINPDRTRRAAIIVKIDNAEEARPQVGLNQADIVYEERVEGITRFAAVFHSTGMAPVGPVRSARSSDVDIVSSYNNPMFLWGGANGGVAAQVEGAEVVSLNVDSAAVESKFRDDQRRAPHNLFINSTDAFWIDPGEAGSAPAQLQFQAADPAPNAGAAPAPGVNISYEGGGVSVDYVYDPARLGWVRFQNGTPHVDSDGVAITPANVAILYTEYAASPADPRSPDAQTVGTGEATVFLGDGTVVQGTWSRDVATAPYTIVDTAGQPILFTPGRTWIALPTPGTAGFLDAGTAQELLATAPPPPASPPADASGATSTTAVAG
jgi:hypothetical protein